MTKVSLAQIKKPIETEIEAFEAHFRQSMKSSVPLLDKITYYIVKRKGKQMRPLFVFLSAKLFGDITSKTFDAASLVELLHTATLVHDDVVDDAHLRRGFFSINALWKNKIAVLVGDYLLSSGLLLALRNEHFDMLKTLSIAVKEMSEGELLQIEKARRLDITENIYYDIIRQKTASLLAASCSLGSMSTTSDSVQIDKMWSFGQNAGMAFQIKDDLFDYGKLSIGKPVGIDIKEKKMTLPLIYALNAASEIQKKHIIRIIKKDSKNNDVVQEVIEFVKKSGGIEYAKKKMDEYYQAALHILETMEASEAKQSLIQLLDYVISREK